MLIALPSHAMRVDSGSRLGPYEIPAPLGKGGMGEVWRGEGYAARTGGCRQVAAGRLAADEAHLARFRREARAASASPGPLTAEELRDLVPPR